MGTISRLSVLAAALLVGWLGYYETRDERNHAPGSRDPARTQSPATILDLDGTGQVLEQYGGKVMVLVFFTQS